MSSGPESYIGVSGVVDTAQQAGITAIAAGLGLDGLNRRIALGVKAVHKTQWLDTPNKYGDAWYPVGEERFSQALVPDPGTLHVAQAYLEPENVGDPAYREHFVRRIFQRGAPWITGIQFDMLPWHESPDLLCDLQKIKDERPEKAVLLQCHQPAMEMGPRRVVALLSRYAGAFDYLLFDASHGTGRRLDTPKLKSFIEESYAATALAGVGLAVAGGLNERTVWEDLPAITESFPDVSWDAEGQLHPLAADGTRPLDMQSVQRYLQASAAILAAG